MNTCISNLNYTFHWYYSHVYEKGVLFSSLWEMEVPSLTLLFNNAPFIRPKELLPWLKLKLYILVNCNKLLLYNTSSFHLKDNILFFVLHMSIKVNILAEKYITRVCGYVVFFLCDTFFFKRKKHKRKQIIVYIYRFNLNENM